MSTLRNNNLSHKARRKLGGKHKWRCRDIGEFIALLLAHFIIFAIPALLLYGVCLIIKMCWRGSLLGFVLLSVLVLLVTGFFVGRRILREREFQSLLSRGVDFGLKDESLQAVDEIVEKYGKRCRRASAIKVEVAPMVRSFASRYNSIRIGKKNVFTSHNFRVGALIGSKGNPEDWYCMIAHEDESGYYVKCSPVDDKVYYFEYEWMRDPVPYASDIRHYIAMRYQERKERDMAKGRKEKDAKK